MTETGVEARINKMVSSELALMGLDLIEAALSGGVLRIPSTSPAV